MMYFTRNLFSFAAVLVFVVGTASADTIVEVIDDPSHVGVTSGPGSVTISPSDQILTTHDPDKWRRRIPYPNTSPPTNCLQAVMSPAPELDLYVTGLDPIATDVYLRYLIATDNNYGTKAGFTSGSLTSYVKTDGTEMADLGGTSRLMEAFIGRATPSSGLHVYIDDNDASQNGPDRCVFTGLRLTPIPEPSTLVMLVAGLVALSSVGLLLHRRHR